MVLAATAVMGHDVEVLDVPHGRSNVKINQSFIIQKRELS
jgi:hypothetical protein